MLFRSTGFKNICGRIPELQKEGYQYFFGYEESIGCAPGEMVHDKDGIAASLLIAEMAAWYRKRGMTLYEALQNLFQKYGYFAESQVSLIRKGEKGAEEISAIMEKFRNGAPQRFGQKTDYRNGFEDIPASNVLRFTIDESTWFAVRPSGTEPKLKLYFYTRKPNSSEANNTISSLQEDVLKWINK